jgi:hypothetical protein
VGGYNILLRPKNTSGELLVTNTIEQLQFAVLFIWRNYGERGTAVCFDWQ